MAKLKPNQFLLDGHIITEIPLLFQTEMVQAVAEDRKTQTRRTRGLEGLDNHYFQSLVHHAYGHFTFVDKGNYSPKKEDVKVATPPYGKPGDLLWVRETFTEWPKGSFQYRASTALGDELGLWKPSIHMPKAACRIWLMMEEIRVERVQDISEEDAVAEGVLSSGGQYFHYLKKKWGPSPIHSFQSLWQSINGWNSWNQNPGVWVVKFRTLSKTGRPSDEVIVKNWKEVANG